MPAHRHQYQNPRIGHCDRIPVSRQYDRSGIGGKTLHGNVNRFADPNHRQRRIEVVGHRIGVGRGGEPRRRHRAEDLRDHRMSGTLARQADR
ncbi:hypothetical protein [Nocardia miyunensis]|uniref:hypothetical protein n=1 Tax=Nocardia miyunensis TaxID=282684 RepID=UPI00082FCDA7|nr:hypothetical protein [Nocardia miyunensis]